MIKANTVSWAFFVALACVCGAAVADADTGLDPSRIGFTLRLGSASAKASELAVRPADMGSMGVTTNGGTVAVVWKGHPRCGADFTVRATYVPADGGWSYAFAYEGNASGLDVESIAFPVAEVPRTDRTELLLVHDHGTLTRPDWSKYAPGKQVAGAGYQHKGAHFIATLDDACGGWYVDTRGDSRFHPVKFLFNAGGPDRVRLTVETTLACPPGLRDGGLPFGGVIRPFRGGWHEAAMIYRGWVKETDWFRRAKANRAKAAKLRDVGLWLWNRGPSGVVTGAIDRVRADAGVPVALDWYWWHRIPYGGEAPYYWPPLEDMVTFRGTIAALKARGVYVQNYINPMLSDGDDPRWTAKEAAEAIWTRDGREKSTVYNPFFNHRSVFMCGDAPLFREKLVSYVRNLGAAGVDGVYLDMVGKAAELPCWNPAHGHPRGGGRACADGYREMIRRMRRENPGVNFSTECTAESFIEEFESVISLFQSPQRFGRLAPENEMPPVYNAIYHDAVTHYGCFMTLDHELPWCHGWPEKDRRQVRKDLVRAYPDQFAIELSRGVANGLQPMVQQLLPAQIDDSRLAGDYRFLCETAKFYHANRDLLYDGEMLAPGTLECPVKTVTFGGRGSYTKDGVYPEHVQPGLPTVFRSVWRAPSGRTAAVLVNWTCEPAHYSLKTPDVASEGELPARSWKVVSQ